LVVVDTEYSVGVQDSSSASGASRLHVHADRNLNGGRGGAAGQAIDAWRRIAAEDERGDVLAANAHTLPG